MRLVDADAVRKQMDEKRPGRAYEDAWALTVLDNAPTVDAVPVCRCKDCKHYLNSNERCELIDTRLHFYETDKRWPDDIFCAWGERKGGDE